MNAKYVVIFEAVFNQALSEAEGKAYVKTAHFLRESALNDFNCIAFQAVTEGTQEIALSYWNSLDDIAKWKAYMPHLQAQQKGKSAWYTKYKVTVSEIVKQYQS